MERRTWNCMGRSLFGLVLLGLIQPGVGRAQDATGEVWVHTGTDRFYLAGALSRSQGVTFEPGTGTLLFSWQYGLQRTTMDYRVIKVDPMAIPPEILSVGGRHIGGIDTWGGILYAPIEDSDAYAYPFVALYNARTLVYTGTRFLLPWEHQTQGVPWVAVDAARGLLYSSEWNPVTAINMYDLSDLSYQGSLEIEPDIGRIQGAKVHGDFLYAASDNETKSVYRVDLLTGEVTELFRLLDLPGVYAVDPFLETEDLAYYDAPDGSTLHVILIQSIFPKSPEDGGDLVFMPSSSLYHFARVDTARTSSR